MDNLEELFTEVLMRLHIELAKNKTEEEKKELSREMRKYLVEFNRARWVESHNTITEINSNDVLTIKGKKYAVVDITTSTQSYKARCNIPNHSIIRTDNENFITLKEI